MKRQNILKILAEHRSEIESHFSVASLSLFGSVARDEAAAESDVDILVTFVKTPGMFGFLELKEYLEHILQCPVDLVTRNALKKQFCEQIFQEVVHAI
ncbi:MAG: nucleotidyltransferase family protein [Proteobacteria bacterium]|nr:nucleotidyltransferase family protein [Pseudomonadota bacterium]MBU4068393.1 nucleotidyltransferase family protein [Pseudomonadota bacterium]